MNSSASSSSSCVLTPGTTRSPSSAIVSATIREACSICSISAALLRMITSSHRGLLEGLLDLLEHLVDAALAVHHDDVRAHTEPLDERLGLAAIELEALRDRFRRIVLAALDLGALEHPLDRDRFGNVQHEHDGELLADLAQHVVERLGLRERARKPVEDEALVGVVLREPFANDSDHQVVGNELPAVVDRLYLPPQLCARRHRRAQDVARRDVRDTVRLGDAFCLRPLARALGTKEQDVEHAS